MCFTLFQPPCSGVLSRLPRQAVRSSFKRAPSITTTANQSVSQPQVVQAIANKGGIFDELCTRIVEARQSARTEQLVWLAKHSLDESTAPRNKGAQDDFMEPDVHNQNPEEHPALLPKHHVGSLGKVNQYGYTYGTKSIAVRRK